MSTKGFLSLSRQSLKAAATLEVDQCNYFSRLAFKGAQAILIDHLLKEPWFATSGKVLRSECQITFILKIFSSHSLGAD